MTNKEKYFTDNITQEALSDAAMGFLVWVTDKSGFIPTRDGDWSKYDSFFREDRHVSEQKLFDMWLDEDVN